MIKNWILFSFAPDGKSYLPVLYIDLLGSRMEDLVPVNTSTTEIPVSVFYSPISFGKLRLWMQFSVAMQTLRTMGFTEKDIDELKGLFADTNIVLLCMTFVVAALHVIKYFLISKIIILIFTLLFCSSCLTFWRSKMIFIFGVTEKIW